jgi:uncharacterized coiled-coil DUF342 family protein
MYYLVNESLRCSRYSFGKIHESDRLHHAREEHQKELKYRTHRDEYTRKVKTTQEQIDEHTKNYGDNF